MARSANERATAFHLYCEGVAQERIALAINAGPRTIATWIKKYDWKKSRDELAPIIKENSKNNKEKLNDDLLRSIKKVWAGLVNDNKANASARDVIETIKLERLIEGESTENIIVKSEIVDDFDELYREARRLRENKKTTPVNNE